MTQDHENVEGWVDARMASLTPAESWQPSPASRMTDLHARRAARRSRHMRWTAAAVVAAVVFVSVPVTRAFGARCLGACVYASSRVVQMFRPDEPFANAPKSIGATIGDIAPDALGSNANGTPASLSSLRGRVVIVNFWATWCGPCRAEIPMLSGLQSRYGTQGLSVIGVSLDQNGWAAIRPFLASLSVNYPVVLGNDDVADAFGGVAALPATFVIDRTGVIVAKMTGPLREGIYDALVENLLAK